MDPALAEMDPALAGGWSMIRRPGRVVRCVQPSRGGTWQSSVTCPPLVRRLGPWAPRPWRAHFILSASHLLLLF
eukprot:6260252-Pyramimonas_sp.AAC.1